MTDIREQEMQNRIDSLTLEKENLRYEIDCLKEQIAHSIEENGFWLTHGENQKDSWRARRDQSFRRS